MKDISHRRNRYLTGPEPIEPDYAHSSDTDELELRYYLNVLIKRRRLLIFVFSTVLVIGAYFSFTATRLYRASSILKIEPQNPLVTGVGEMLKAESVAGPSSVRLLPDPVQSSPKQRGGRQSDH